MKTARSPFSMRRLLSWMLSLALLLSFVPAVVPAASAAIAGDVAVFTFSDSGITVTDETGNAIDDFSAFAKVKGTALTINAPGNYVVTGSCTDGSVTVKKSIENVTLTLRNLTLNSNLSAPVVVKKYAQVDILIEGTVTLTDTRNNSEDYLVAMGYATYDSSTDIYTYTGTLSGTTAGDEAVAENAVMKFKGATKVTLGGTGTLNITAKAKNGIKSGATLVSLDDDTETAADPTSDCFAFLEISDLTLNVNATDVYDPDGTGSGSGGWGQQENETYGDCINAESSLRLISGTYNIAAGDDGIKSDYYLTIGKIDGASSALDINVTQAVEGLEGAILNIYSGDMDLVTSDDAINAANSDLTNFQYQLNIYGGDIYANGGGDDGLDSNGWLKIYGGKVVVFSGSDQTASCFDTGTDGNSSIDDTFLIEGGNVLGLGQSGMAITPETSSQDWVSWGSSSQGGPGWGGGGGSGSSSNMSDYSNIKLKVGNSTYSVGSSVSISSNSTVSVLNGSTTMATTTAPRSFTFALYSANFSGASYNVTFNANGGSGTMAAQTGAEASDLTLNPCAFTRTGLTFAGWNTAADGSGDSYTNGETLTMWQDVTLYAQWISTEIYTLTYDANGGVGSMESQSGTMLDSLIVAANGFTKDGYAFTGWNTAADGTGTAYAPTDGITLNANTTLYAQWQPGFVGSFDTDSGVAGIDVYYTKDYTTPDETNATETYVRDSDTGALDVSGSGQLNFLVRLKDGYVIDTVTATSGAYKNIKEQGNGIYRITKITASLTVTVTTAPAVDYTVTFSVPNGLPVVPPMISNTGTGITLPTAEAPEGYTFLGWVTETYDNVAEEPATILTGHYTAPSDITLYALYSYVEEGAGTGEATFDLVSSAPSDWSGDYVITYNNTTSLYAFTAISNVGTETNLEVAGNATAYASTGMTLADNKLSNVSDTYVFRLAQNGTGCSIQSVSGNYYVGMNSSSYMIASTGMNGNFAWTLTIGSNGNALIMNSGVSNSNYPYFSYSSYNRYFWSGSMNNSQTIYLWKATQTAVDETKYTTVIEIEHTHTPGAAVKENEVAATCTAAGGYDMVVYCTVCNAELSREHTETPATGHSWGEWISNNDGTHTRTCAACGETETHDCEFGNDTVCDDCGYEKKLNFSASLSLDNATGFNYKVAVAEVDALGLDSFHLVVVHTAYDKATNTYNDETVILEGSKSGSYYSFDFADIPAMALNDKMVAHLEGTKNGETWSSNAINFNAIDYCYLVTTLTSQPESLRRTCANLILFAESAQINFSYNTANLPTAKWSDVQENLCDRTVPTWTTDNYSEPLEGATVTFGGLMLDVNSRIDLRFVIVPGNLNAEDLIAEIHYEGLKGASKSFTIPGSEWTDYGTQGRKTVTLHEMNAGELQSSVAIVIKDANGNAVSSTLHYSVDNYAGILYNLSSTSSEMKNLMVTMINYSLRAKVYLETK